MHNPTRRNRKTGTSAQGHGQDNRDRVPRRWEYSRDEWVRAPPYTLVRKQIGPRSIPFLVEPTLTGCVHPCTVDDIATVLRALPEEVMHGMGEEFDYHGGIRGIVLRQPTRKEMQLNPVWGDYATARRWTLRKGPIILLESQPIPLIVDWGRHLAADEVLELERLTRFADDVQKPTSAERV
ncbi:MAG: hypothetical protein R3F17_09240 [Planctomycetota bacterium]